MLLASTLSIQPRIAESVTGGPVILMGIDAEDGGVGGHGPIAVYDAIVTSLLTAATNGGTGILVIGSNGGNVNAFWNQISTDTGVPVTYVTGASITTQSFAGFKMIAIVSDVGNTPSGGLTNADNTLLSARAGDIATFVNNGGALLGFSSCSLTVPFGYVAGIGGLTCSSGDYSDITPTVDGTAVGITDALDVCCWHDMFVTYPSFLKVLANVAGTTNVAAIGGQNVVLGGEGCSHGFFKANATKKSATAWTAPYTTSSKFDATFGVDISINWSATKKPGTVADPTLLQALQANGGGLNLLARDGTAALLNAADPNINSSLTEAAVILKVQQAVAAYNSGDMTTFNALLKELYDGSQQLCPVNQNNVRVIP